MMRQSVQTVVFAVLVALALGVQGELSACGSCLPSFQGSRSGPITYRFDGITGDAQNVFTQMADQWNNAYSGTNISLVPTAGGDVVISLDFTICPAWGETRYGQFNYIKICPDTYVHGTAFLERTIGHEFGHILGLGTSSCSKADTVMTTVQPGEMSGATSSVGCADAGAAKQYFTIRRDNDQDGYSPDDYFYSNQDCEDDMYGVHPGAYVDCDNLNYYPDVDCDDQPDAAECGSPLIVDVDGDGIRLTSRKEGVLFDLNADGTPELLPWTAPNVDDAWLVYDRDGDGQISDGTELFGSYSPQRPSSEPNGYIAISMFDEPDAGGNGDGSITAADAIYSQLRLWQDRDHNGQPSPHELVMLAAAGVVAIQFEYKETWRADRFGNVFRYKAKLETLRGTDAAHWSYDVFLWASDAPGNPHPYSRRWGGLAR
jgi:hypothetical protein